MPWWRDCDRVFVKGESLLTVPMGVHDASRGPLRSDEHEEAAFQRPGSHVVLLTRGVSLMPEQETKILVLNMEALHEDGPRHDTCVKGQRESGKGQR